MSTPRMFQSFPSPLRMLDWNIWPGLGAFEALLLDFLWWHVREIIQKLA